MSRAHIDPRMAPPEECVLRYLIDRRAAGHPDKVYALFADGTAWTYGRLRDEVRRAAAGLQALGVGQGDRVLSWLPNGPDALRLWYASNYLGAVWVPINTAYRGRLLEHVIDNAGASLLVAHARLVERLHGIGTAALRSVVVLGGDAEAPQPLATLPADSLEGDPDALRPPGRDIQPWDVQTVIYTSGTTGPSKGVLSSYLHLHAMSAACGFVDGSDRWLVTLPLFHAGGTCHCYRMLVRGGSIALVEAFDTSSFWDTIRRTGTTAANLLGAMMPFLMKAPPTPADRDHTLRVVTAVPFTEEALAFSERFGVDVHTCFNMTEVSWPLVSGRNPRAIGTCGRPRPGIEARIVDENDCELPPGAVGELILRADCPWTMSHGYHGNPEATARAWRNGWFHTGDAFRRDADGNFFFVDRLKDAIRRRGENISSFEVESEILAHPGVREAAVVAVPSAVGEDDVLAAVAPVAGHRLDPAELIGFLAERMAYFMVPRYVRTMPELPKTPTQKVQKHLLRTEGVTADTWDREAAGMRLRRERFAS